jgi:subtilisin family serine protease
VPAIVPVAPALLFFWGTFMKRWVPLVAAFAVAACQDASGPPASAISSIPAPVFLRNDGVPDRYIVVLNDAAQTSGNFQQEMIGNDDGEVSHSYRKALKGFAARLSPAAVARLSKDPRVKFIEQDQVMSAITVQNAATWGIDRVDQRNLPLSTTYEYNADGTGVTAYIIDTGIRFDHAEFGVRAVKGYDAVTAGGTAADCNGHGTHVSGTVGGTTYGVAKNVKLVAVRVLDCAGSGTTAGVIAGIDWVTNDHVTGAPAVANMSLGGGASTALDNAVINSINDGVTYAVAAGNSNVSACTASPARAAPAITVASTTSADARSSFSNFGTCVDIFAPGSSITSAWYTSATATNTISGTSMATPHVVGVAALYLQGNPTASPAAVEAALEGNATPGKVTSAGTGSPNLLLYVGNEAVPPPPPPPPTPVAAIASKTCSSRTCSFTATTDSRITSYSWNFGNGSTASGSSVSHRFARNRNYTVTLTTQPGSSTATTTVSCTNTCK